VRWIGILGIVSVLVAGSAAAMDENRPCLDLESDGMNQSPPQGTEPLLTDNQCEALTTRELRALLLEIPQEEEDPVQLSLGIKNGSGTFRLKIPFSF
jgi:hypothetical protein